MSAKRMQDNRSWTGWHRPNCRWAPWRRVCQAESWDACWDLLGSLIDGSGDSMVLEVGRHPDGPLVAQVGVRRAKC